MTPETHQDASSAAVAREAGTVVNVPRLVVAVPPDPGSAAHGGLRRLPISSLIEIFYGLAIASGIQHVAELLQQKRTSVTEVVVTGVGAAAVAIGDWAIYNLFIAGLPYRRVTRIVADMLVIVTIFFLFEAIGSRNAYVGGMFAYFALGSSYHLLLRREHAVSQTADDMCIVQATLAMCLFVTLMWLRSTGLSGHVPVFVIDLTAGIGVVWSAINLRLVDRHLRVGEIANGERRGNGAAAGT